MYSVDADAELDSLRVVFFRSVIHNYSDVGDVSPSIHWHADFPILFAGTTSASNIWFGFTLGGGDGVSVPVVTLGGVKRGTCGWEKNGGVGRRCGAVSTLSYLYALFSFILLPGIITCSRVVSLRCSSGFLFSSCDILSIAAMTRSSSVTSGLVIYLCLWNTVPEICVIFISFIHIIQAR